MIITTKLKQMQPRHLLRLLSQHHDRFSTLLSLIGVAFDEHTLLSLFRLAFSGVFSKLSQRVGLGTSQESGLSSVHVLSSASPCFQTSVLESTCVGEGHVPWVWCLVHRVEVQRCLQLRLSSGQELHKKRKHKQLYFHHKKPRSRFSSLITKLIFL